MNPVSQPKEGPAADTARPGQIFDLSLEEIGQKAREVLEDLLGNKQPVPEPIPIPVNDPPRRR